LLANNISIGRNEIDIIAQYKNELIFIEVKTRTTSNPIEAITKQKEKYLLRAAEKYLYYNQAQLRYRKIKRIRFDVVGVVLDGFRATVIQYEDVI